MGALTAVSYQPCLFCGGDAGEPGHADRCDGRQGHVEAEACAFTVSTTPDFDGDTYEREFDHPRLTHQLGRIYMLMRDGEWRTLAEIEERTGDPAASISAQLRHLRKRRFGEHTVNKRARGDRHRGLYEYQLIAHGELHGELRRDEDE